MKKYKLTKEKKQVGNTTLYRIKAIPELKEKLNNPNNRLALIELANKNI